MRASKPPPPTHIQWSHDGRDSEAALEHAANLADLSAEVLATVSVVHGELLGEPSAELRAKLADSDVPVLFMPYQSM